MFPKQRLLPKWRVPLIGVELPEITLPEFPKAPRLDERRIEILRHAIADDLGDLVPVIGDLVSDTSYAEMRKKMTPEEYERFVEENKVLPSSLATLKVFME